MICKWQVHSVTHPLLYLKKNLCLECKKAWMNSVDTKDREILDYGVLGDCIRVLCILELVLCFCSPKEKLLRCSWGARGAFFQRITEEDKGGSQLNISLPTLLFFSCSRRRLSSRGNWKKRIPNFDWRHNSLYVVALTSTPKLLQVPVMPRL